MDDCRVITLSTTRGKGRTSGLPIDLTVATVYTPNNGRIVRAQGYDTEAEALGVGLSA